MNQPKIKVNVIGAGRFGLQLALAIKPYVELLSVTCRTFEKAREAQRLTGAKFSLTNLRDLPNAELTFLTTPDDSFNALIKLLKQHPVSPNAMIVHCSGLLPSDILQPLRAKGYAIGSIHPFRAFMPYQPHLDLPLLNGCPCFAEGDALVLTKITTLFERCGATIHLIDPAQKTKYHLAAVLASNHLITLAASAQQLLTSAGISEPESLNAVCNIIQSSLNNLKQASTAEQALTGPIVREDVKTLEKHLLQLSHSGLKELYCALSRKALELTSLSPAKQKMIRILLDSTDEH